MVYVLTQNYLMLTVGICAIHSKRTIWKAKKTWFESLSFKKSCLIYLDFSWSSHIAFWGLLDPVRASLLPRRKDPSMIFNEANQTKDWFSSIQYVIVIYIISYTRANFCTISRQNKRIPELGCHKGSSYMDEERLSIISK